MNKLYKNLSILRDLTPALLEKHPNGEDGFWIVASVENPDGDTAGDVIRIDGIDLVKGNGISDYHRPAERVHLKVTAQHLRHIDGKSPTVAVVTDWAVTASPVNGRPCKALALYCAYLKGADGKRLDLAEHYYQQINATPAPGIDSGSVEILYSEYSPTSAGGRDIPECQLVAFSLVTEAGNAHSNLLKSMGYEYVPEEPKEPENPKAPETPIEAVKNSPSITEESLLKHLTPISETLAQLKSSMESLGQHINAFGERLDVLDSALVLLTPPAASGEPDQSVEQKELQALAECMKTLAESTESLKRRLQP